MKDFNLFTHKKGLAWNDINNIARKATDNLFLVCSLTCILSYILGFQFTFLPLIQTLCFIFEQDVESYDPILNPVLNRELRRTGGRVLITIGDQDIDLSPSFTIFLSTRDPTVRNTPFAMGWTI